ncbi:MAG: IS110 family transposase [Candidatus Omnitrophica bacterium]|nr:IS110 family transposase [Candidatus Omnitrophota bacterium]
MNYAGIDLHKHSTYVSVMKEDGEIIGQMRVRTNPEELRLLLDKIPKPFSAVLETSGNWYWVYDLIEESAPKATMSKRNKSKI